MQKILAIVVMLTFVFGFVVSSYAGIVSGTITKIDGNKVTVKQADGNEVTVEVKDVKDIKVGDKVTIKDGIVKKEKGKEGTPAPKKKKVIEGC